MSYKTKAREWLRRYLIPDIVCTILSIGVAWAIMNSSGDRVLAAFVGSAVASIVFYGMIAFSDIRRSIKKHKTNGEKYKTVSFLVDFRNLIIEFGPAELIDVLAVRPFFMYLMPKLIGDFVLGTFVGKMIADVIFFVPAILMYELRKRHLDKDV